jgi:hypothetical protein
VAILYVAYYLRFYYPHWVDTSAGGLLISEGIARPIVNAKISTFSHHLTD